mgnify:CR=1 FL=1
MKKTILLFTFLLTLLNSCSPLDDAKDALDTADCTATLIKISNNDDDLSCSELIKELEKLEKDCREFLNEETKANIALIKASCEDS